MRWHPVLIWVVRHLGAGLAALGGAMGPMDWTWMVPAGYYRPVPHDLAAQSRPEVR